ncbi:spore germination protein [Scopulibacillus darangshiensis]|uniref:Spore germination protein n=1 Tax=Scopulibacillus darangshiensis TaxID=442528 RepID=A0A4R2NIS6_9BACL|nr:GerAB/ArcD/ProY family transporter [Scopulibacillus darangshiensis]TCP21300.1 spore germination protein [Scopulibacillus darangshiensis]
MSHRLQIGFVFIILYIGLNHTIYPDLIFQLTNTGHWEVVLCQGLLQLTLIWIYIKGLSYFPGQDVIDIYLKAGKLIAFIILIPFVISLTALIAYDIRLHTEVIISVFLSRTPYWPVLVLLFFITTYIALNGLGTILRSSVFIFLIVIPLMLFVILSSLINFDWHNATPVWHSSFDFLMEKKFFYLMGFAAFLPLGFMAYKTKLTFGFIFLAWVCVMISFLSVVYIPLFIFGQEAVMTLPFSMIRAISSVDIRWFIFNQQTIFLALSLIGFTVILNAVLLWMIGRIMHKMLKWKKVKTSYWIIVFSIIAFIFALFVPSRSWTDKWFLWSAGAQVYFMIVIPFSTLICGFVMKRGRVSYEKG